MSLDTTFSTTVSPADNFFLYVNQNWLDNNPIPSDFNRWGSFNILDELNKERVKKILEETYPKDSDYNKFSILYNQGLDIESRKNTNEIKDYVNKIYDTKSMDELLKLVVDYQMTWNIGSPFYFSVYNDFDNANMNILHLFTGGLGLPDRDYYFLDSKSKERDDYKKFLRNFNDYFKLKLDLDGIYKLEEDLAKNTYTRVEKRKPELLNNPRTLDQILGDYPSFVFAKYFFDKLNVTPGKINISNPNFFFNLNKLFYEVSLDLWKDYFALKFLLGIKSYLSIELEEICFNYYGKVLSGTPEIKPLWKRALANTEEQFGQLIGKCFVDKYFSEKAKASALKMIEYLKGELRTSISNLDWMEPVTKTKAVEKLDSMKIKIGYPDKWRHYLSDVKSVQSYLKNNLMCNKADNEYRFAKLYKEVDRTEWFMDPHVVNAYYSPSFNEIVFPAGILQPPFFSEDYDMALNFGGIGAVIGHEMTHGFDDQGCKYDSLGNLNNWWTSTDSDKYKLKTEIIKNQFNEYIIENEKVNGELTLGENIADLGGLTIALEGFKKYLKENPSENKVIEGLSPMHRFFINYSKIWRCANRPEDMKQRLMTDPHSPPIFRVNGVVKNINDFYELFNVDKSNELYLDESKRAKIW